MMFCRQSIHYFTFVIHFDTHSFHFSVFLRNPQSEEKRKYPKGSRRFQYKWYEKYICEQSYSNYAINIKIDQITIDFISASVLKEYSQAIFNF